MAGDVPGRGTGHVATPVTSVAHDMTPTSPGTWVLQDEAASRAGCSVSAIRKWRRTGVVPGRTVVAGGVERVEVRLEDVRRARSTPGCGGLLRPPRSRSRRAR